MQDRVRKVFLVALVIAISLLFVAMIRQFVLTILLAAIFTGLAQPLHSRLLRWFRERRTLASICTLFVLIVIIVGPLLGFLGVLASEAFRVSETVGPWIQERVDEPGTMTEFLERVPGYERIEPYRAEILTKLGQLVGALGNFLFQSISATTRGTIQFLFQFTILLYTMFFFLKDGRAILDKILYYMPLPDRDEERMVDRFVSVTRATLKGTLIIGILQGTLAGLALAVAGIQGAVFWGTVMTVLSIIPGIGTALIWAPAAIYLAATGHVVAGILLAVFCGLVVGSIDNFLRPWLVGKDVKMHDLMILLGTMGGIFFFGVVGFVVGPIIAALFVTIWDIYGEVFRDVLPPVRRASGEEESA